MTIIRGLADRALRCADRVALLHGGRLVGLAAPAEAITGESLRALYGVDVEVVTAARASGAAVRICVPALASPATSRGEART